MATTATITLSSDIMATYGGYSKTMTLTQGGTLVDIDSTTGFQRRKLTSTTATDLIIMADASLIVETKDSSAAKVYIKNIGDGKGNINKDNYVSISLGTSGGTTQEISKLYGGDWMMIPVTGIDTTGDVYATSETDNAVILEYAMYYEEN